MGVGRSAHSFQEEYIFCEPETTLEALMKMLAECVSRSLVEAEAVRPESIDPVIAWLRVDMTEAVLPRMRGRKQSVRHVRGAELDEPVAERGWKIVRDFDAQTQIVAAAIADEIVEIERKNIDPIHVVRNGPGARRVFVAFDLHAALRELVQVDSRAAAVVDGRAHI